LPDEAQVYNELKLFFFLQLKATGWSALLFAFSLLDGGGASLAEEVGATGVWLVETAASGRSADEVSSAGDWLVKTVAPGSWFEDDGFCAGGDDVPHKLMSPIIEADKSSN
jgi:hypothetical protein